MFSRRASGPAGEWFAETELATHRFQADHFPALTPSAAPAPLARVPASAHRDAPACGSAQMPEAQAELSDTPAPLLLQTPAAHQTEPDSVFLLHEPMPGDANLLVPCAHLNQLPVKRRDRE